MVKKIILKLDKPLLIVTIVLCCIGLLMVFSSSSVAAILRYHKAPTYFFIRQLIFFIVSFILGYIIMHIPTKYYKSIYWIAIFAIIGLLFALLLYGSITNHVQSWFYIGPIAVQPSEFSKSIIIIFMACFYDKLLKEKVDKIHFYFIPLAIVGLIGVLVMMQPDFGSALILMAIGFCIFISIPTVKENLRKIIIFLGVAVIIVCAGILYSGTEILNSDQLARFKFQSPCQRYKEDTGYQVCNGFIAINNGGLFGVGIGKSTQKYLYLPESHTDFIFAIFVEELGLLAGLFVLLLYGILLYRLLKIAKEAYVLRNSILAYGTFWYFALHVVINLCGMLALLPLTGVPLPLMSYGGSSILNFIVMLSISQRVAIENKSTKYKLELKKLSDN